jgi:hypothetical protein
MNIETVIHAIDQEIGRLEAARKILAGNQVTQLRRTHAQRSVARKPRNLSPEGRQRIRDAVKRRWELQKSAAAA